MCDDRRPRTDELGSSPASDDARSGPLRTTRSPAVDDRFPVGLRGVAIDSETRCAHWHTAVDVVALRFGCCAVFSPCHACHAATADHDPQPWPRERFHEAAVFCGVCETTLSARAYLDAEDSCPNCGTAFNPGCRRHRSLYFEE